MARPSFQSILDDCLNALERGEPVEACLARYPRHAQELRPLLTVARRLRRLPVARPQSPAQAAAWQRFYQRASDLRLAKTRRALPWLRPLAIAASLLLGLILAGGGTIYAASRSLPDSPLYRVKLATEEGRLWFVFDDTEEADILLDQSETRIDEIMKLVRGGKEVPDNVLSALRSRTSRASRILEEEPGAEALRARARELATRHEELLVGLWDTVSPGARDSYAAAVATLHNTRLRIEGVDAVVKPEDLEFGVTQLSGVAQLSATDPTVWIIGGLEVRVDDRAIRNQDIEEGRITEVVIARGTDSRLRALSLVVGEPEQPAGEQEVVITGVVQAVDDDELEVAGQRIAITESTLRTLKLNQGRKVEVTAKAVDGKVVATTVKAAPEATAAASATITFEGTIEEELKQEKESIPWRVGGQTFLVTAATVIDAQAGDVEKGARGRIKAERVGSDLLAKRIVILAGQATKDSVNLEGVFQGVSGNRWQISGVLVDPPSGQTPPAAGTIVKVEGKKKGTTVQAEQAFSIFEPDGNGLVSLRGLIRSTSKNEWRVGLTTVKITEDTHISGKAIAGARAQLWARQVDGALQAVYIDVLDDAPIVPTFRPPQQPQQEPQDEDDDEGDASGPGNSSGRSGSGDRP